MFEYLFIVYINVKVKHFNNIIKEVSKPALRIPLIMPVWMFLSASIFMVTLCLQKSEPLLPGIV